jgi:ligand-binding sensor domain-containing protein/signal transduction histidine kinase
MKRKLWSINSNIFLKRKKNCRWQCKFLLALLPLFCSASPSGALSPNKALSEFILDQWRPEQGFPGGAVRAFAQTPDGYLWIGTDKGLLRFDGINFVFFANSDSSKTPIGPVFGLAVDVNGDLWVRLEGPRLLRYRGGVFQDVSLNLGEQETGITAMSLGKDGRILLSGFQNGVVREANGFEALASREVLPRLIISMTQTPDGKIWLGTREQGLFTLEHERVFGFLTDLADRKINCLLAKNESELWIGTDNGLVRSTGATSSSTSALTMLGNAQVLTIASDRDSNVWVGTSKGLFRVNANGISSFNSRRQHPDEAVTALFEDREGNFWVGTSSGVWRLRDSAFTTYSHSNGLPADTTGPIYVDSEARTWFSPSDGGLYWLRDGRVERVNAADLSRDVLYSIDGRAGELWIGRRQGLTRLRYTDSSFTAKTYTQADGLAQNSVYAVHQSRDGSVWAGTLSAGVSQLRNNTFTTYTTANGLASNTVSSITESADRTMWFGTPNGVSSLSQGRWRLYTTQDGLPPGNVNCLLQDSTGTLWIGTDNGLAFIRSGIVQSLRDVPDSLREPIFGIEQDHTGSLWISTAKHVLRVHRDKLLRQPLAAAELREYGLADGLLSSQGIRRDKSVTADSLGRIWFSTNRGLSFVDPGSTKFESAPALVHVNTLSADGRQISLVPNIRVPAPHHRITLTYTGLSLAVPERVRFKYRLDDFDQRWTDPTSNREATYTNLEPGHYVFRVVSSNSEGAWNGAEAAVPFEIEATLWQTLWFQLCAVLVVVLALIALSRLRMLKLASQLKLRFEERLSERTRIAQELHDTLLQGVISASMQLHVVADQLPADSAAKPAVDRILGLMGRVVDEGRNAVGGLRTDPSQSLDLAEAFSEISREISNEDEHKDKVAFHVTVEGQPRPLHPIIRNDIYSIGREALINAFRHAQPKSIEVELEYASYELRVLIRDDGIGFDSKILRFGRHGHWGLSGMRERAKRIGARLKLFSRPAAGTEVELIVPGQIAFVPTPSSRTSNWFSRLLPGWKRPIERHPNEFKR